MEEDRRRRGKKGGKQRKIYGAIKTKQKRMNLKSLSTAVFCFVEKFA